MPYDYNEKREIYKFVRSQIEHEDGLVNQRLTWLLLTQAFLFTAYFTTLNTYLNHADPLTANLNWFFSILMFVMPWGGIALVVFEFRSIAGAFEAIKLLREYWYHTFPEEGDKGKNNKLDYIDPKDSSVPPEKSKDFPDITYVGTKDYGDSANETSDQENWLVGIKSSIIFMFERGFGSRTISFGTPMVIFCMWLGLFILQLVFRITSHVWPDNTNANKEIPKLEINVSTANSTSPSVYILTDSAGKFKIISKINLPNNLKDTVKKAK